MRCTVNVMSQNSASVVAVSTVALAVDQRVGRRTPLRRGQRVIVFLILAITLTLCGAFAGAHWWAYRNYQAALADIAKFEFEAARGRLKKTLRVWPSRKDIQLLDARTARRAEQFDEAEQILTQIQESADGKLNDALTLEWVLLRAQQGDVDPLVPYIRAQVESDHPDSSLILEAATRGYLRMFRYNDASFLVGLWLEREPENMLALYLQGVIREQIGPRTQVPDNYRRVLRINPDQHEARIRLVNVLLQEAMANEAIEVIQPLLEKHGNELPVQLAYAQALYCIGERERAEQCLDGILAANPDSVQALAWRGRLALDHDEPAKAESLLQKAAAIDPSNYEAHLQLYQLYRQTKRDPEAAKIKEKVEQIERDIRRMHQIHTEEYATRSKDPLLYAEVGSILLRANDRQRAFRWFTDGLRIDPENRELHAKMAEYYRIVGDEKLAAVHAQMANMPIKPPSP